MRKDIEKIYDLFNLPKGCTDKKLIKSSYRKLAKESHPDTFTDPEYKIKAQELFTKIKESYETLCRYLESCDNSNDSITESGNSVRKFHTSNFKDPHLSVKFTWRIIQGKRVLILWFSTYSVLAFKIGHRDINSNPLDNRMRHDVWLRWETNISMSELKRYKYVLTIKLFYCNPKTKGLDWITKEYKITPPKSGFSKFISKIKNKIKKVCTRSK